MRPAPVANQPRPDWALVVSAELALTACTVAAIVTFWRLFIDNSFFPKLFVVAILAHTSAAVWRRLGRGLPLSALLHALVGVVGLAVVFHPGTTLAGVPTPDTIAALHNDLINGWRQFQVVKAPAPVLPGFLVAGGLAAWWAAFVADWAAFRLWLPLEALVPSASIFVFAALLGQPDRRVLSAVVWITPALLFALLHRVMLMAQARGWIATGEPATNPVLLLGVAAIAVAVGIASVAGARIPGADAQPLLDVTGNGRDDNSRVVTSPFLELNARLNRQSDVELFTVLVSDPNPSQMPYWRMTSLHQFDGSSWSSPQTDYKHAKDSLPTIGDSPDQKRQFTQVFTITKLGTIWLPAAFQPASVDAPEKVRWDANSSTLIVGDTAPDANGFQYTVVSDLPEFDRDKVAAATDDQLPDSVRDVDLALPDNFSALARQDAEQVVAGIGSADPTPYQKALALQQFFDPKNGFTYDLNPPRVPAGANPITDFLTKKVGFCQQYAGTYAAMARAIGLPARVAIGFTPGDQDPSNPNLFHVKGLHAHAWPEVYIDGAGWVPFEPTPSRGQGAFANITGRTAQQSDSATGPSTVDPNGPPGNAVPTTAAPSGGGRTVPGTPPSVPAPAQPGPPVTHQVTHWLKEGLIIGMVIALVVLLAPILAWNYRRRRRRARTTAPGDVVALSWDRALEAMALLGFRPARSDTPVEIARKVEVVMQGPILVPLATALTMAAFSAEGADDLLARSAVELANEVEAAVQARLTFPQQVAAALRPWTINRRRATPSTPIEGVDGPGPTVTIGS